MRSLIVTHNIGHSVLEGFENRFAPVVLEDRSQVGLGAVLYAGCRIGAEAIVASNSYVVGEIPAGAFAIGVPGEGDRQLEPQALRRAPTRARAPDDRRPARAARAPRPRGLGDRGRRAVRGRGDARAASRRAIAAASTLRRSCSRSTSRGDVPEGVAVLDLLGRRVHGSGGVVLDPCASSAASAGSSSSRGRGVPRRPRLTRESRNHPGNSCFSGTRVCAPRGQVSKARAGVVRKAQVVLWLAAVVVARARGVLRRTGPARRPASRARQGHRREGEARGAKCSTSPASSASASA